MSNKFRLICGEDLIKGHPLEGEGIKWSQLIEFQRKMKWDLPAEIDSTVNQNFSNLGIDLDISKGFRFLYCAIRPYHIVHSFRCPIRDEYRTLSHLNIDDFVEVNIWDGTSWVLFRLVDMSEDGNYLWKRVSDIL